MTLDKTKLRSNAERVMAEHQGGPSDPVPALAVAAPEVLELLAEIDQLKNENRRATFWRSPEDMPGNDSAVVVLRDAGVVGNPTHPGSRTGLWLELTSAIGSMFACDMLSTGQVIGWMPAAEFQGLPDLISDAERYRGVRRVANRQGYSDEQFDQQTDIRVANFDAAMAKEAPRG